MKTPLSKLLVLTIAILLIVAACAAPPPPLEVAQKYQDAFGRHDIDTVMSLLTDDATYAWGEYFSTLDKPMIRNWHEYAAGLNADITVNNCKPTGATVTCEWRYVEECGRIGAVGNFDVGATSDFTIQNGKIDHIAVRPNLTPGYMKWERAFFEWLGKADPVEASALNKALTSKEFGRELGKHLGELCGKQAESLKATPTPAPSSDLLKLAQAYQDAFNKRDLDAALALFVDDGLSFLDRGFAARDKQTARDHLEADVGYGYTVEIVDCTSAEEALRCTALSRNNYCFRAWCGLDLYHTELTLKSTGGKIQFLSIQAGPVSRKDEADCTVTYPKYVFWAQANRPEDWKKLSQPVVYDLKGRALGELGSQVCKAYLEATK